MKSHYLCKDPRLVVIMKERRGWKKSSKSLHSCQYAGGMKIQNKVRLIAAMAVVAAAVFPECIISTISNSISSWLGAIFSGKCEIKTRAPAAVLPFIKIYGRVIISRSGNGFFRKTEKVAVAATTLKNRVNSVRKVHAPKRPYVSFSPSPALLALLVAVITFIESASKKGALKFKLRKEGILERKFWSHFAISSYTKYPSEPRDSLILYRLLCSGSSSLQHSFEEFYNSRETAAAGKGR